MTAEEELAPALEHLRKGYDMLPFLDQQIPAGEAVFRPLPDDLVPHRLQGAACPRPTPGAQHPAAAPLAISSGSAAKPDASMRTAAIAAYLDRNMPPAASVQPPAKHPWQDRAAFVRPARGQAADPPAIRIHIGQIRVAGPSAAPGPHFSRPVPRLGLAAYIERRQDQ